MPITLLHADEADAARAVAIEKAAHNLNRTTGVFFPGPLPSGNEARINAMITQRRDSTACHWVKVVDTDIVTGDKMIAFSMWYIWDKPWPQDSMPMTPMWGLGTNPEACELFFGVMRRKWEQEFAGKPHMCK